MPYQSYNLPTDIVSPDTILVDVGTEDPNFLKANISDFTNSFFGIPAKLLETSGAFVFDFAAAQRVDRFILWHNLDDNLAGVKLQGNATNSWGTPSIEVDIDIEDRRPDGYTIKSFVDLIDKTGYSAGGYRYWRIVSTVANSLPIGFKVLFLDKIRTFERDALAGMHTSYAHAYIDHMTDTGYRWAYDLLMGTRTINGSWSWTESMKNDFVEWYQACLGRVKFAVLIPDTRMNDAWLVRFMAQPADMVPSGQGSAMSTLVTQQDKINRHSIHQSWDEAVGGAPEWQ